jgi:hypothetical protein
LSIPESIFNGEARFKIYEGMSKYNAFLVMVKTNYNRIFGFFVPQRFRLKVPTLEKPKKAKQ